MWPIDIKKDCFTVQWDTTTKQVKQQMVTTVFQFMIAVVFTGRHWSLWTDLCVAVQVCKNDETDEQRAFCFLYNLSTARTQHTRSSKIGK